MAGTPRHISVVSADIGPRVPTARWQPSVGQSVWTGALAGGGAAAGVGAGVCTVSLLCPPCYAACVAAFGVGGMAVGVVGGRVAHRQLASDPANRMLPDTVGLSARLRTHMIATLAAQPTLTVVDGGAAALPFARDDDSKGSAVVAPVAAGASNLANADVLEIALTEIHADALRKGGFEVTMKARARLRIATATAAGEVADFDYSSKRIAEGGSIEAEAQRIAAEVEHGMDALAVDIRDELVGRP